MRRGDAHQPVAFDVFNEKALLVHALDRIPDRYGKNHAGTHPLFDPLLRADYQVGDVLRLHEWARGVMHKNQVVVGDGVRKCLERLIDRLGSRLAAGAQHGRRNRKCLDVVVFGTDSNIDAVNFRHIQQSEHGRLQHRLSASPKRQVLLGAVGLHARAAAGGGHHNEHAAIGVGHSYI